MGKIMLGQLEFAVLRTGKTVKPTAAVCSSSKSSSACTQRPSLERFPKLWSGEADAITAMILEIHQT